MKRKTLKLRPGKSFWTKKLLHTSPATEQILTNGVIYQKKVHDRMDKWNNENKPILTKEDKEREELMMGTTNTHPT